MEIMKSIIDALLDFVLKLLPLSPFDVSRIQVKVTDHDTLIIFYPVI